MKLASVLLTLLTGITSSLFAAKFQIAEMEIKSHYILLSIHSFFLDDMDVVKIINDGIEVDVTYEFWVLRDAGAFLPAETITNFMVNYNVKKDIINQGFEVCWEKEGKKKEMWYDTLDEVLYSIMNPKAVRIVNIDDLSDKEAYFIETQLNATSLKLYPPLSLIYNLFGKWSFSTPKIQSGKFNKNGFFVE